MIKIGHSQSFWTTLLGKDGKKCEMIKIGHRESIWKILVGKDREKCKMTKIGHSESFGITLWEKIGKSVKPS